MLIIDKAENNPAKLPSGKAAHTVEYDVETNEYRVLDVATNTFCSGGGFLPNGTLISGGGAEARVSLPSSVVDTMMMMLMITALAQVTN